MGLRDKFNEAKLGVVLFFVERFGKDIGAGEHGEAAARVFNWVAGQGAAIGAVIALITGALETFQPEYSGAALRYIGLAGAGATAIGVLKKLYLKEPVIPAAWIQAAAHVASSLAAITGAIAGIDELVALLPTVPSWWWKLENDTTLYLEAATVAAAYFNRMARAYGKLPTVHPEDLQPKE